MHGKHFYFFVALVYSFNFLSSCGEATGQHSKSKTPTSGQSINLAELSSLDSTQTVDKIPVLYYSRGTCFSTSKHTDTQDREAGRQVWESV
jgi:hypothetical protein